MRKVCIQVERRFGEQLRQLLGERDLLDRDFPITSVNDDLLIPVCEPVTKDVLVELEQATTSLKIVEKELDPHHRKPHNLASALQNKIPEKYLETLPHALDIIGEIAVVELDEGLQPYENLIGEAIMLVNPRVTTAYAKVGGISGIHRIRPLRLIAGEEKVQTIHTEYGVQLAVDVSQTYFSPRLSTEHDRIAKLVQKDEVIVDMFTGVGPFAIHSAKRKQALVYAIDINEAAIKCLRKSLTLNRLKGKVVPLVGDARTIIPQKLSQKADRIIMNLPHEALSYLDTAAKAMKPIGGIIHFYSITTTENPLEKLQTDVTNQLASLRFSIKEVHTRVVRPSAPYEDMVVFDLHLEGTDAIINT